MCHSAPSARLPAVDGEPFRAETPEGALTGLRFGESGPSGAALILPDIYGMTPFYRGLAAHLAAMGGEAILLDPFADHGELSEQSREAAFARRHLIADTAFVDSVQAFMADRPVRAVMGFCLGGNFVLELARRDARCRLLAVYPFPQGLANRDALPAPVEWLPSASTPMTILIGQADMSVGPEVVARLQLIASANPVIDLTVYAGAGHGFMTDLDSADPEARGRAEAALARAEVLLGP